MVFFPTASEVVIRKPLGRFDPDRLVLGYPARLWAEKHGTGYDFEDWREFVRKYFNTDRVCSGRERLTL